MAAITPAGMATITGTVTRPATTTLTITMTTASRDITPAEAFPGPAAALSAPGLLQLMWLASPALPVGGFSYSEGLEMAVEAGHVTDEASAGEWLVQQLQLTQARADMTVVARTVQAWRRDDLERVRALNDWVLHTRETGELRLQAEQMGRSLADWLRNQQRGDATRLRAVAQLAALPPTWPVAFALAGAFTGAGVREILLAHAFGWAENMVQAAIKSVPLGQSAGQRILARLAERIPAAADRAIALPDDERQAFSPMLAILSARHENQYSRLFRS